MASRSLALVLTILSLSGCKLALQDSATKVPDTLSHPTGDIPVYSYDASFSEIPEFWLGNVGIVRKANGNCSNGVEGASFEWSELSVRNDTTTPPSGPSGSGSSSSPKEEATVETFLASLGYQVSRKSTDPVLRMQSVVTRQIATDVKALSFFAGDLSADVVAEVVLSDTARQRIAPSKSFEDAITAFRTAHKADIFDAADICYVFVVSGYTQKTLLRKYHSKTTAKAGGGYSGVSVNGSYFASNSDYKFDPIFALSVRVIKRPGAVVETATPTTAKDAEDIQSSINETTLGRNEKSIDRHVKTKHPAQPREKLMLLQAALQ